MKKSLLFAITLTLTCAPTLAQTDYMDDPLYDKMYEGFDPGKVYVISPYSEKMDWHEKLIPDNWICGYAINPFPYNFPQHGIFLVQDREGYMLLLNVINRDPYNHPKPDVTSDSIRIDETLAGKLKESLKQTIDNAKTGPEISCEYDGSDILALMPGKKALRWAEQIPDMLWREQLNRFGKKFEPYSIRSGGVYHDTKDMTFKIVRKQVEIVKGTIDPEKGTVLNIPSNVEPFRNMSYPINSIAEYAFKGCQATEVTLNTLDPIVCPVNAFESSVYENAVLNVPKGWKQRKAARTGAAWGKFKNVRYY